LARLGLGDLDVTALWLQLLACPMCAQAQSSKAVWLLPFMFAVPYVVSAVVIRFVRRLA
jgi:hypothetical protein